MTSKGHALSRDALIRTLTAYSGITTEDGEVVGVRGTTLVDSNLKGRNDFISEKTILIMSGDAKDEDKGATSFNSDTGEITLQGDGFSAQIKAGTIFRVLNISSIEMDVARIEAKIGASTDGGAAATLFGRHKKEVLATHAHLLLVVHSTAALNTDLDTPLKTLLEEFGFEVEVADPTDVAGNLELNYDGIVVSASCDADDAGNGLAKLKYVDCPVVCHSAAIAVSAVFNLGTGAGTEADQTTVNIVDNTVQWFLDQATGDLIVTTAATIYTIDTETANAVTLAEEAIATGDDITCLILFQGQEDRGDPAYAPDFDRVFFGLGDASKANDTAKDIYFKLYEHLLHEKRYSPEVVVTPKRVYQEDINGSDFELAAIDTDITNPPPSAALDNENTVVEIPLRQNKTFVLRSLWVDVTDFGGGTQMTFQLWVPLNGTVTSVDSVVVSALGIQNLMDIFGLPEVHADGIWITVIVDAGDTGACSGTYRYGEAKK